jgi:hypothetical protein
MTLVVTLSKAHFEGWLAGELRACGIPVQADVPDCAVLKGGRWDWVEVDFTLRPLEEEK